MGIKKRSCATERGQALAEQALVIGLVSLGAILALYVIGDGFQSFLMQIGITLARH